MVDAAGSGENPGEPILDGGLVGDVGDHEVDVYPGGVRLRQQLVRLVDRTNGADNVMPHRRKVQGGRPPNPGVRPP
jgi:hypothetical protein